MQSFIYIYNLINGGFASNFTGTHNRQSHELTAVGLCKGINRKVRFLWYGTTQSAFRVKYNGRWLAILKLARLAIINLQSKQKIWLYRVTQHVSL